MKIIKIIKTHRKATDEEIKKFIYRNMPQEMITGLEYDDPKTIARALKMFGIDPGELLSENKNDEKPPSFKYEEAKHKH